MKDQFHTAELQAAGDKLIAQLDVEIRAFYRRELPEAARRQLHAAFLLGMALGAAELAAAGDPQGPAPLALVRQILDAFAARAADGQVH